MTALGPPRAGRRLGNPFHSLRHRSFRLLWTGEMVRTSAQWMDEITRAFLILEVTDSNAHLALVTAARGIPLLFLGLGAGILADRVSRKRLLMASQGMNIAANIGIALLVALGLAELWHVYLTALVIGVGMALNAPALQAALPSLVPADDLQQAVVLSSATLNIGQAVGPVVGGVLVATVGLSTSFAVQAAMFVVAGLLIRRMELPHVPPSGPPQAWRASLADGARYLRSHPVLPSLFLMMLVPMVFVQPFRGVAPAIATQQLGLGPAQTGTLLSAIGLGAMLGVVVLATLPPVRRPGPAIVVSAAALCVTTLVFALTSSHRVALAAVFGGGVAFAATRTLGQSLLLDETDDAYRGRMSSIHVVNRGMIPIGSLVLGGLTPLIGAAHGVAALATVGTALVGWLALRSQALWRR